MIQPISSIGYSLHTAVDRVGAGGFSVPKSALRADGARSAGRDAPAALASPTDLVELQSLSAAAATTYIPQPPPLYGQGGNANARTAAEAAGDGAENGDDQGVAGALEEGEDKNAAEDGKAEQAGEGGAEELSSEEQKQLDELKARDREVRAHEQAHKSAGGQYAGAVSYSYQQGPDGNRYAIGGEVSIDISPERDPAATAAKMRQVRAAAMAPAEPSSQDRAVAAKATQLENEARQELNQERAEKADEAGAVEGADSEGGDSQGEGESNAGAIGGGENTPSNRAGADPVFGKPLENASDANRMSGAAAVPTATLRTPYAGYRFGGDDTGMSALSGSGRRLVDVIA